MNLSKIINNGDEFPPLGSPSHESHQSPARKKIHQQLGHINSNSHGQNQNQANADLNKCRPEVSIPPSRSRHSPVSTTSRVDQQNDELLPSTYYEDSAAYYRLGSRLIDHHLKQFDKTSKQRYLGTLSDFVLAPIAPLRPDLYDQPQVLDAAPDLILQPEQWNRVVIDLGYPNLDYFEPLNVELFDKLFRHALYLRASMIVISCPVSHIARASCASIINKRLKDLCDGPLVLFEVPMDCGRYLSRPSSWLSSSSSPSISSSSSSSSSSNNNNNNKSKSNSNNNSRDANGHKNDLDSPQMECDFSQLSSSSGVSTGDFKHSQQATSYDNYGVSCPWRLWNNMRNQLVPDKKIGVCLATRDAATFSQEDLDRWSGEPVRMIVINTDQFVVVSRPGKEEVVKLTLKFREFIRKLMLANSLKTSLVLEGANDEDLARYMHYLQAFILDIERNYPDQQRSWNDRVQPPLQPLSSNLDSAIYSVFEGDRKKYTIYRDAMIEALDRLFLRSQDDGTVRTFVLMVLGAGRGPLVDMFIEAIRTVNSKHKFKIYALDKNPSSILTLRYKQKRDWSGNSAIETEVVESDMREWRPALEVKADIIATELLGSFSDNELSPECIDGVWPVSTPKTISIPQEYSSYLAPICSFKLFQEISWLHSQDSTAFNQIYVSKLNNYYMIDRPQRLFTFEHKDLSLEPKRKCNERFKELTFKCDTETVCHGFAGYFSAHLFGTTHLSTIEGQSTANMDSWYPAFIPLEHPVQLAKGSCLRVLFWRKESSKSVWYEWTIAEPVIGKIYSQSGIDTAMSKCID